MCTRKMNSNPAKYLTPLTPAQMKDVHDLIAYTEANRKPLRKPRIRKRDPNSTPRPVNCFLVYRKEKQAQIAELCVGANHRVISKIVARWWKNIDEDTKSKYVEVAKQVKREHAIKFPGYKYAPKRKQNATIQDSMQKTTTQPVNPANVFFKSHENHLPQFSTPFIQQQSKPDSTASFFDYDISKQFNDLLCIPHSYPLQHDGLSDAPLLSQPLVDDCLARYMDSQQWQMDNSNDIMFNQVLVPPQITIDTTSTSMSVNCSPHQDANWNNTINPHMTITQQHDGSVHPLDMVNSSNPLGFSALGCDMNDVIWSADASLNNHNWLDMICTPDLLAVNDSPLSVSSSYCLPGSFFTGSRSDFVNPTTPAAPSSL